MKSRKKRPDAAYTMNDAFTRQAKALGNSGDQVDMAAAYTDERGGKYNNDHPKTPLDAGKGAGRGATPVTLKIANGGR